MNGPAVNTCFGTTPRVLSLLILILSASPLSAELPLAERTQSFTIALAGSVAQATPLFGPVREAEWAPDWKPHFLHPPLPAQRAGAIFTTEGHHGRERLWLVTTYDVAQGRVAYVFVSPGFSANEVRIEVTADGPNRSRATITYHRAALSPAGNEEVAVLTPQWADQQKLHWDQAMNAALQHKANP